MIETELREVGDWIDDSVKRQEELLADALEAQRLADPTRGKTVADSARECEACGDWIPQERREAVPGVRTCAACQEGIEAYNAMKGRR